MKIEVEYSDFQDLIVYASRYALGRMTYVADDMTKIVGKYMDSLSDKSLDTLFRDIKREETRINLGLDSHHKKWLAVLNQIKENLDVNV